MLKIGIKSDWVGLVQKQSRTLRLKKKTKAGPIQGEQVNRVTPSILVISPTFHIVNVGLKFRLENVLNSPYLNGSYGMNKEKAFRNIDLTWPPCIIQFLHSIFSDLYLFHINVMSRICYKISISIICLSILSSPKIWLLSIPLQWFRSHLILLTYYSALH